MPIATPEGIAIGTLLVFTIATGLDTIFLAHIDKCMGINEPRADTMGIFSEDLAELFHKDIHQSLAFLRRIAYGESLVGMPIPRITPTPLVSGSFDVWLGDFPPSAYFTSMSHLFFHHSLVTAVYQGIVLQEPCTLESITVDSISL